MHIMHDLSKYTNKREKLGVTGFLVKQTLQ